MDKTFAEYFKKLMAEMTTASAGVGSRNVTGDDKQGDFYAPDDERIAKPLGGVETRRGTAGKKEKNNKKKDTKRRGINGVFLKGEDAEEEMCPDACCGMPVNECTCGPDCEHCDCYEINNG